MIKTAHYSQKSLSVLSSKKRLFTQALLASSLFVTQLYANTTIPPNPMIFPVVTNGADNNTIQILFNGQVNATGKAQNAILINSGAISGATNGGNVIVDAGNINGVKAIVADANKVGVVFQGFGVLPNGTLTINGGSGIDASAVGADAIRVEGVSDNINNAGTIQANQSAIYITDTGLDTHINNSLGGVIQSTLGAVDHTILSKAGAAGPTLTLMNAGTITQISPGLDTIQLNSPFISITNNAAGVIKNTGLTNLNNAINIKVSSSNGNITNNEGGLISATGAGYTLLVWSDLGTINNAGTLQSLGTGGVILLNLDSVNNTVAGIVNTGDIIANDPQLGAIANFDDGTTITNNLVNSGNILVLTPGDSAIDFGSKITHAAVIQNGGVIAGEVLLAQDDATLGSKVFTMNGGTIAGNVVGSSKAGNILTVNDGIISGALQGNGGASNTFNLNGGEIAAGVTLGNFGDLVNLAGTDTTSIVGGTGNDVFNVTDGSFTSLEGGKGINILNVNKTFTANGTINNVQIININKSGTIFTTNAPITNMNKLLTINPSTALVPNNLIQGQGDILNNGTIRVEGSPLIDLSSGNGEVINNKLLKLEPNGTLTIQGNPTTPVVFTNSPSAIINTQISGLTTPGESVKNGQLIVNSALPGSVLLDTNSYIQPTFSGFIPKDTIIDVVTEVGGGTIYDNAFLKQPNSAVVSFQKIDTPPINTKQVQLRALRNSYASLTETSITDGIAHTLDGLAFGNGPNNPTLLNLLGQLDALHSRSDVDKAMQSLLPPFNYGLIAGSYLGMDNTFESVQLRIEDLVARRTMWVTDQAGSNGLSFGDPTGMYSFWGKILGAYLNQGDRNTIEGYRAKGTGVAFGADWGANNCTTFGLAGSFTRVNVDDKSNNAKDEKIKSWQGTAYGWWEFYGGIYIDAMVGLASNRYTTSRHIHVNEIDVISNANFKGKQYGVQGDLGWSFANEDIYYFVPFARLKYIHLNLDDYQENGAGDLSLLVHNDNVSEFLGGIGFRTGSTFDNGEVCYVPEMTILLSYDFKNQGEQTVAGFFGGGTAFATDGVKPGRTVIDMAFGLNVHFAPDSIFSVKYNLELRKEFCGNALYFQYNYLWE